VRLNPGSQEAILAGCTCPVKDNRQGKGIFTDCEAASFGGPVFWYAENCPLHRSEPMAERKVR
jgi:hypothetical protein